jgi:hypothetical protein
VQFQKLFDIISLMESQHRPRYSQEQIDEVESQLPRGEGEVHAAARIAYNDALSKVEEAEAKMAELQRELYRKLNRLD